MAYAYDRKVIISGKQVEVYKYRRNIWKEYERKVDKERDLKQLNIFEHAKNRKIRAQSSINRTRTQIRRIVNSNPELNKFLTLTFADNIIDLKQTNNIFNKFIKRLTYQYSDFKYVAVFEFQKRGAVHYHLLCDLPFVKSNQMELIWKQGFIKLKKTNNVSNIGAYMSKYLGKEIDERTFGKKKFFKSQNLKQPIELMGYRADQFIERFLADLIPVYEKTFNSDWTGEIDYKAYTLNQNPEIDKIKPLMLE
ncbi:MAG: hypothetical protein WAW11_03945 [Patescibacteria group bacterium]